MSKLFVNEIAPKTSGNRIIMPQGGIIQVQYTQFSSNAQLPCDASTDRPINVLSVNITPASASSVIHLKAHVFCEFANDINSYEHMFFFYRDSTKLGRSASGNRNVGISMATRTYSAADDNSTPNIARYDYFDTPGTTSTITYKVGINLQNADTLYLNRTVGDVNNTSFEYGISLISATEIAG